MGFGVGDLQHILGVDDPLDVVNGAFENRHAGEGFLAQQFDELFDCGVGGDGDDFGPGLHGFANSLFAELHHRLNEVAVAFVQNAFFLASFDQRVHGFRLGFGLLLRMLLGQGGHRLQETQHQGYGQAQGR